MATILPFETRHYIRRKALEEAARALDRLAQEQASDEVLAAYKRGAAVIRSLAQDDSANQLA
jgi:hypothetical protein